MQAPSLQILKREVLLETYFSQPDSPFDRYFLQLAIKIEAGSDLYFFDYVVRLFIFCVDLFLWVLMQKPIDLFESYFVCAHKNTAPEKLRPLLSQFAKQYNGDSTHYNQQHFDALTKIYILSHDKVKREKLDSYAHQIEKAQNIEEFTTTFLGAEFAVIGKECKANPLFKERLSVFKN